MSSYKRVWKLSNDAKKDLKRAVKTYLDEELLKDIPPYDKCEWDRTRYSEAMKSITLQKMSMCTSIIPNVMVDYKRVTIDRTKLAKVSNPLKTQELCNRMVHSTINLTLDPVRKTALEKCREHAPHKIRYLMIHLGIDYIIRNCSTGHATLLLFDFKRKHQIFFDPADVTTYRRFGCSTTVAVQSSAIIQGFKPVPIEECACVLDSTSFQNCFENNIHQGQCGVMTTLIALCCNRFNYYHMKNMANVLLAAYDTPAKRKVLSGKMIGLLCAYPNKKLPVERVLPDTTKCKSFCMSTKSFCSKPSCPGGTFCWVHRQLYVNPFSKKMECTSPVVQRPFDEKYFSKKRGYSIRGWWNWMLGR